MTRTLLTTLLLAAATAAEPALQSRPPALDLSGPRIAALNEMVRQAEQAITDKRLTLAGRGGLAARDLLREVLTVEPFHPQALAVLERLIGALDVHARSKLKQEPPDLEGARKYAGIAAELVALRGVTVDSRLASLYSAITAKDAEAARSQDYAASSDEIRSPDQARPAVQQASDSVPEPAPLPKPKLVMGPLRAESKTISYDEAKMALRGKGMTGDLDGSGYRNDFVDNRNGTVTDRATGLMWQKGGSAIAMSYTKAEDYVKQLKSVRFAGHDDWRLPTLEEAASLLEPMKLDLGLHIDPVFDETQAWIWTADKRNDSTVWGVYFNLGQVVWDDPAGKAFIRACRAARE